MALPLIAGVAMGVASSAYTMVSGAIRSRKARKAIEEIERNRIQYENNFQDLQVSTLGADLQKDQLRQNNASLIGAMSRGGSRAMVGAVPRLLSNNNQVSRQIGADLDEQQKRIDLAAADYQNKIQETYDQRQRDALIGYGQELQSRRQDIVTGANNLAGIGMAVAGHFGDTWEQNAQEREYQYMLDKYTPPNTNVPAPVTIDVTPPPIGTPNIRM